MNRHKILRKYLTFISNSRTCKTGVILAKVNSILSKVNSILSKVNRICPR